MSTRPTTEIAAKLPPYATSRISIQSNGCWHWTGSVYASGYGMVRLSASVRKPAHRYIYELLVGPIGESLVIDHQCHNRDPECRGGTSCFHRRCVNPDHLEPTTAGNNVRRGKTVPAANLAKDACPEGHPYSHADQRGWRKCRTCEVRNKTQRRRDRGVPERKIGQPACKNGHEFTAETTRWSRGKRYCKSCDRDRSLLRVEERRKPCKGCGGPKEPGGRYRYCTTCRPRVAGDDDVRT